MQLQLLNVAVQGDALDHQRVAGGQRGHFRHRGAFLVLELHVERAIVLADTVDRLELSGVQVPHFRVDGALGDVGDHVDLEVVAILLQQLVALANDAPFALLNVGGLPRNVDVVQRDKAVLHVGAGAHARGRADQHADVARLHKVEQGLLLNVGVGLLHEADFVLGDALGHELPLDLVIGVPATGRRNAQLLDLVGVELVEGVQRRSLGLFVAVADRLGELFPGGIVVRDDLVVALGLRNRAIEEDDLRPLVLVPLAVGLIDPIDHRRDLAIPAGHLKVGVNRPRVERDLAGPVHQPQALGPALLGIADLRQSRKVADHLGENLVLLRGGQDDDALTIAVPALTRCHIGDRELAAWVVLGECLDNVLDRDRVGHGIVEVHQRAHVRPLASQARDFLHAAGFGRLPLGRIADEHRAPCVEVFNAHLLHLMRHEVAQEQVHFRDRIADRGAGQERYRRARPLSQGAHLEVQVHGLLRSGLVAHARNVLQAGRIGQVLEFVGLVHRQVIDSHFLERQQAVALGRAQPIEPRLQLLHQALGLGHGERLAAIADAGRCSFFGRLLHRLLRSRQLLADVAILGCGIEVDKAERAVADDDHVEVAGTDAREQAPAVGALEVLLGRTQHIGARVEQLGIVDPLLDKVVRHHHHGLAGQAHAPPLHDPGDCGERLARADDVIVEHGRVGNAAPDSVHLVPAHLDDGIRHLAVELEVRTVALANQAGVELLVEDAHEVGAARLVGECPVEELVVNLAGLGLALGRGHLVHDGFLVLADEGDLLRLRIEQARHDRVGAVRVTRGVPLRGGLPHRGHREAVGDRRVGHRGVGIAEVPHEVGIDLGRNPRATDDGRDLVSTPILGDHRLQRLDVGGQALSLGGQQLPAHKPGQVQVARLPAAQLGIVESGRFLALGQGLGCPRLVRPKELPHAGQVNPPGLGQVQRDRLAHVLGALGQLWRRRHTALHNVCLGERLALGHLGRENEPAIGHHGRDLERLLAVQVAVLGDEGIIGLVQQLAVQLDHAIGGVLGFQRQLLLHGIADR